MLSCWVPVFWAALWAQVRLADDLPSAWEGQDIAVIGVVTEMPQLTRQSMRFRFEVERVLTPDAAVPAHVQLSWYRDGRRDEGNLPRITAGERWQLTVRLKRPHGSANPHVPDYEARLFERNVRATGYVRAGESNKRLEVQEIHPVYLFERKRDEIRSQFQHYLAGYPYAGVLIALTVGDQQAIPSEQWETLPVPVPATSWRFPVRTLRYWLGWCFCWHTGPGGMLVWRCGCLPASLRWYAG